LIAQTSSVLHGQPSQEFAGAYHCEGVDATGAAYRGTTLIGKQGDAYHVQWTIGGRLTAVGIGVARGDTLAVSYYGPSTGVVLYTRTEAGLAGQWTQPGGGGTIFAETLTRIPDDELPRIPFQHHRPPSVPGLGAGRSA
jgi:hypothetical protein